MKTLMMTLIALSLFHGTSDAAAVKTPAQFLKQPFYLGDKETENLNTQIAQAGIKSEVFTVTMRCNKYKRTPQSKGRTLNCLAFQVEPETVLKK